MLQPPHKPEISKDTKDVEERDAGEIRWLGEKLLAPCPVTSAPRLGLPCSRPQMNI